MGELDFSERHSYKFLDNAIIERAVNELVCPVGQKPIVLAEYSTRGLKPALPTILVAIVGGQLLIEVFEDIEGSGHLIQG